MAKVKVLIELDKEDYDDIMYHAKSNKWALFSFGRIIASGQLLPHDCLNYKEIIDWINENGGLDIKY